MAQGQLFVCWVIFHVFVVFISISYRSTIAVSNSLDPDQARRSVGPDLGPTCLQRLFIIIVISRWWKWGCSIISVRITELQINHVPDFCHNVFPTHPVLVWVRFILGHIHLWVLSQHPISGHYRSASETPLGWRFAGGPIVAIFYMLTECIPFYVDLICILICKTVKIQTSKHSTFILFLIQLAWADSKSELVQEYSYNNITHRLHRKSKCNCRWFWCNLSPRPSLNWVVAWYFQQCGILTSEDLYEPV